jgi:hypothetical protein
MIGHVLFMSSSIAQCSLFPNMGEIAISVSYGTKTEGLEVGCTKALSYMNAPWESNSESDLWQEYNNRPQRKDYSRPDPS